MAAATGVAERVQTKQAGIADAIEDTTNGSGFVLPFIHTSITAVLDTEKGGHRVVISVDGATFETPPVEHLIFYAGLAGLAAAGIVEWPVAVALGVGHVLIEVTHRPGVEALGEVLEEA